MEEEIDDGHKTRTRSTARSHCHLLRSASRQRDSVKVGTLATATSPTLCLGSTVRLQEPVGYGELGGLESGGEPAPEPASFGKDLIKGINLLSSSPFQS